jgi:cell division protein ZapE
VSQELKTLYKQALAAHQFHADKAQQQALAQLEELRVRLLTDSAAGLNLLRRLRARPAPGGGLYLWGEVGRGKTWLMDLFYGSLADVPRARLHFHHFMRDVHGELGRLKKQREPLRLVARQLAARARVLCLDELFVSDIADAMILGRLFDGLLREGVSLVITSNIAPGDLYRDGLQRARFLPTIELLQQHLTVHELSSPHDYRLRQLQRAPIYLQAASATEARAQMSRLYERLAGEHGEQHAELRVAGRRIAAWRRSSGMVWFAFDAICEGARSQNDYLEIAAEFHTVFLSDVPQFDELSEDAARRFIALVDEFYDQGVKLVIAAAAAPTELYRGQRLAAAFQRTASRLVEMQSESYLARPHRRLGAGPIGQSARGS